MEQILDGPGVMVNVMLVLLGQCSQPSWNGEVREGRSSLQRGLTGVEIRNHAEAKFGKSMDC